MIYALIIIKLYTIALFLSVLLKKNTDLTFPLAGIFIVIIKYLFGLFIPFGYAHIFINISCILCGLYLIRFIIKNNYKAISTYISKSVILLILLYIISIHALNSRGMEQINQLGTWGLMAKNFYLNDSFFKFGTNAIYTGYMPFMALFDSWFLSHFKDFHDGLIYIGNSLFNLSLIISICSMFKCKYKVLITILAILLLPFVSNAIFTYLYVEQTIALLFSFGLIYIIQSETKNRTDITIIGLIATALFLVKSSTTLFIAILLCPFLLNKNDEIKLRIKKIIPIIVSVLFIKISWSIYLDINNLNSAWDTYNLTINNLINFISGNGDKYQYVTLKNFLKALINNPLMGIRYGKIHIPFLYLFLITVAFIGIVYAKTKEKELKELFIYIVTMNMLFTLGLLLMYVFIFSVWEAVTLSAFIRYIQILSITNLILFLYVYFSYNIFPMTKQETENAIKIIIASLLILNPSWYIESLIKSEKYNNKTNTGLNAYKHCTNYKNIINKNDKLLLVTDGIYARDREKNLLTLRYVISPIKVYISARAPREEKEIINKLLCDYNYIFFDKYSGNLISKYQFLSKDKIKINNLYKIIKYDNNELEIKNVENII